MRRVENLRDAEVSAVPLGCGRGPRYEECRAAALGVQRHRTMHRIPPQAGNDRLGRHQRGALAELAVADYLFARGFRVLARNVRLGALELDVVARRGGLVAVVEVRTRGPRALTRAFESVSRTKRARVTRAVERLWKARLRRMRGVERVRIDVAAVTFTERATSVEYVEAAF